MNPAHPPSHPSTCRCQEEFQLRSSQSYMRSRVLQAERGICQHCGLAAHDLFLRVRDAPPGHRKEALESTWLAQLPLKQVPWGFGRVGNNKPERKKTNKPC